jgi:FAD/FMN-containing dehydrogenase
MTGGLLSWGRYPAQPQQSRQVHWRDDIRTALQTTPSPTLPFGNGRAYGDSCLAVSGTVIHMRPADRIIAADWTTGVMRAEAGITLAEILEHAVPRGWFLPVVPGTSHVTLGGAIANDVHGKNHHRRGTFGCHVRAFELVRSDAGPLVCSHQAHGDLFRATIGGLGLTGVISWAEIALMPVSSIAVETVAQRFDTLEDFFALAEEKDHTHEYGVAWIDGMATGRQRGRGIYIAADHARPTASATPPAHRLSIPFTPPVSLVNSLTTRIFNPLYWRRASPTGRRRMIHHVPFFQPLDGIRNWNRLYGRRGFQQFQCVVPDQTAPGVIGDLLDTVARSGLASPLAVLKRCGDIASPGLLSFPMKGVSLAIDFPQSRGLATSLLPRLDAIVHLAGGRLYPAKDAHMSAAHFKAAYPEWKTLEQHRDPALKSRFWERVTT